MTELEITGIFVAVVVILSGGVAIFARHQLSRYADTTVGAVYRTALHAAQELEDRGLEWLLSDAGIAYRRLVVERAYDFIPSSGIFLIAKMIISKSEFCNYVEQAFVAVVELAEKVELEVTVTQE